MSSQGPKFEKYAIGFMQPLSLYPCAPTLILVPALPGLVLHASTPELPLIATTTMPFATLVVTALSRAALLGNMRDMLSILPTEVFLEEEIR